MKRLRGFSLMEMMIVLTIVAIVAAASAPMVNKKMVRAASEKSPWIFTNGESIAYNLDNPNGIQDNKTARIGTGVDNPGGVHPRLYITTNSDATPHVMFGRNNNTNLMRLIAGGAANNIWLSSFNDLSTSSGGVVIGPDARARATFSVVIGRSANSTALDNGNLPAATVTIGRDALSANIAAVTVGQFASVRANEGIAIGNGAQSGAVGGADRYAAIAIGSAALSNNIRSIAVGRHAEATGSGSIAMGSSGDDGINNRARAMGSGSVAIGQSALAQNNTSVAIGGTAQTSGNGCIAIGSGAHTGDNIVDSNAHMVNRDTQANKIAIGTNSFARRADSIAIGNSAIANPNKHSPLWEPDAQRAIAIGSEAQAFGADAIAIGNKYKGKNTLADTGGAIALGTPSQATGVCAIAIGGATSTSTKTTTASGRTSIAIGIGAQATAENSVAIGTSAQATAANTIVLGDSNSIVYIPGKLVVNGAAVLGYHDGKFQSDNDHVAVIRSRRDYKMEILQRDGDGDWDAVFAGGRVDYSWADVVKSDRRLKNVGKEFTSGLDKIKKLEVFNYTFKDDKAKTPRVGVIAQDLQKIFPDAVVKGEDGFLRIRMEDMFYAVINAIKELDNRTSLQEKKIKELEKRIEELEKRL